MGYTLYLASQGANWGGASGTTADLVWNVNFDELFNKENLRIENRVCSVRYRFMSQTYEDISGSTLTPLQRSGWLACNLQSINEKTSIGYPQFGVVLGQLAPVPTTTWTTGALFTNASTLYLTYDSSTMSNRNGVKVLTPQGVQQFRVQMWRHAQPLDPSTPTLMVPTLMTYGKDYTLMLDFEFEMDD